MADDKASDSTVKPSSTGGLRTDNYGKATPAKNDTVEVKNDPKTGTISDPLEDPKLNDFADLMPGDSKIVESGPSTGNDVPGVPGADVPDDVDQARHEAGIPSRPIPAADTDLHATSGGYQVTPAGVLPEELDDLQRKNTRQ